MGRAELVAVETCVVYQLRELSGEVRGHVAAAVEQAAESEQSAGQWPAGATEVDEEEAPVRTQDAVDFSQRAALDLRRQVVEDQGGYNDVERVIVEWKIASVPPGQGHAGGKAMPSDRKDTRIRVDADVASGWLSGDERAEKRTGPAPEVEEVLAFADVGEGRDAFLEGGPEPEERRRDVV
jgi:hypothetical protein